MNKLKLLAIIFSITIFFTACGEETVANNSDNLLENLSRDDIAPVEIVDENDRTVEITDFSLDIFEKLSLDSNENVLISPLSIISALSMTANGADNETLSEMETVLGSDIQSLNDYLYFYLTYMPNSEKNKFHIANSIWLRDDERLEVFDEFLQINKNYYNAQVFKAPFNDETKNEINSWVKENTDGIIEKVLTDPIPAETIMYLINALSFDGEWEEIYKENQVFDGNFTSITNEINEVKFMRSTENSSYVKLDNANGVIKPYANGEYSFVAFLPDENTSLDEFVANLSGEELINSIKNPLVNNVNLTLPKFSYEYSTSLNETLISLGMNTAFNSDNADFSKMAKSENGNIYIGNVIHKTKIEVDEKGTKAGAVTVVEMMDESAAFEENPPITIDLNRPFFYMIIDQNLNLPIFMGTVTDLK